MHFTEDRSLMIGFDDALHAYIDSNQMKIDIIRKALILPTSRC